MSSFELALIWETADQAPQVVLFVKSLAEHMPREKLKRLEVVPRMSCGVLAIEADFTLYIRAMLKDVEKGTQRTGGAFVELLRLPEDDRKRFKEHYFKSPTAANVVCESYAQAATALEAHFAAMRARQGGGTVSIPPKEAATSSGPLPPIARGAGPGRPMTPAAARPAAAPPRGSGTPAAARAAAGQRKEERYDVQLAVEYKTDSALTAEYASNISKGGIFIKTTARPQTNTYVQLSMNLPNGKQLLTSARVVHCFDHPEHGGVGLAFENRDPRFQSELAMYIAGLKTKA